MKATVRNERSSTQQRQSSGLKMLQKVPTGIPGLDQITDGGLPKSRTTLVCGRAGCGKTLLSLSFLMHGALQYGEPGVFLSFEEKSEEIAQNIASLGFDLPKMEREKKILTEYVHIDKNEIEETGEYDLEGLFVRLDYAIKSIGAKRVVLDTLEALFSGFSNASVLRSELIRLFRWLKDKGVTALVTAESGGENQLTRNGLEEYVSDCVIFLDHRIYDQISTRRLRVVKYRGSAHGTNEYPFLIDESGISVIPITSLGLEHTAPTQRISTGIRELDAMFGGKGYYRGSSIIISGTPGTGKTSFASYFANACCKRGEKTLYFAFEESESQLVRNLQSVELNMKPCLKNGTLKMIAVRPTLHGLERHLMLMHKAIDEFKPKTVIVDPINNLILTGSQMEVRAMLIRLIDYLKVKGITGLFTSLSPDNSTEQTDIGISSLMDTWIFLRDVESSGVRKRGICILKSRGMSHSNQIREFMITGKGIRIAQPFVEENMGTISPFSARVGFTLDK